MVFPSPAPPITRNCRSCGGEDAAFAYAIVMHLEHDMSGLGGRFVEMGHQDVHDEIHRRVVVVVEQHLPLARALRLAALLGGDRPFLLWIKHESSHTDSTLAEGEEGGKGSCGGIGQSLQCSQRKQCQKKLSFIRKAIST